MDHDEAVLAVHEGETAQPMRDVEAVRRVHQVGESIRGHGPMSAEYDGKKVQVVIAENGHGGRTQRLDEPRRRQRLGAAIDQIAGEPEPIHCPAVVDFGQQRLELRETTL